MPGSGSGCPLARPNTRARDLRRSPPVASGFLPQESTGDSDTTEERALGQAPTEVTSSSRVAVVELDGLVFGLCVDRATDVLAVGSKDLQDPPTLAAQAGYEAVKAVVRRPDSAPVLVLSLEQILESVYRSVLPHLEEG